MSTVSHAALPVSGRGRPLAFPRRSDELLARQAARGSDRAFTAIYERYYQPLYRYCRSIVRNDTDAQDALQSTFTSALAALQRDARNAPLRPWLYRIAHNESISLLRRRRRDQHEEVTEWTALASSVEEQASGRARWQRLVDDLAELPERQRGALLLRELAGLSHEDIAVALGVTVGAAKQAIFEARQGLTELEEGRAMSCEEVRRRVSEGDRRILRGRRVRSHIRSCAACEAFAVAIPARQTELRALAPTLPPAVAGVVLSRVIGVGSSHAGLSAGAGTAAAGGVGKVVGTAAAWKAVAGVVVVAATATAGVTGLTQVLHAPTGRSATAPRAHSTSAAPSASAASSASAGHSRVGHHTAGALVPGRHSSHASSSSPSHGAGARARHHSSTSHAAANGSTVTSPAAQHGKAFGHSAASGQPTHGRALGHANSSSRSGSRGRSHVKTSSRGRAYGHTRTGASRHTRTAVHRQSVKPTASSHVHSGGGLPVKVPKPVDQVVKSGTDKVKNTASSLTGQ
jgi:RNA polymerase sigma factor (sigma-70 family)